MSCIFIFRRDLRLTDNTALIQIANMKEVTEILPIFIYDHNQISGNFTSNKFLIIQDEALNDLNSYLLKHNSKLHRFYGTPYKVISYLIQEYKPAYVAFNIDYSTYSNERDRLIASVCKQTGVKLIVQHDVMMCGTIKFTKLFWEFTKKLSEQQIIVRKNNSNKYTTRNFKYERANIESELVKHTSLRGIEQYRTKYKPITATRQWALDRIKTITINETNHIRDGYLISAHLKLGLISPREVFKYAIVNHKGYLIKQMAWREFYFACWRSYQASQSNYDFYDRRFDYMQWRNDPIEMEAMWRGRTGYALVDAAITELNKTGFMANRGRLIVGFFSVKILRINPFYTSNNKWLVGGQIYFSRHLIDACYANNTGNWHWVASDTVDASGQRFGRGWAGRPMNVEVLHPGDEEYICKWIDYDKYKTNKIKQIVNAAERWKEWISLTQ